MQNLVFLQQTCPRLLVDESRVLSEQSPFGSTESDGEAASCIMDRQLAEGVEQC